MQGDSNNNNNRMWHSQNAELFETAERASDLANNIFKEFNLAIVTLAGLPPHKRIFLFFLARASKTYRAIYELCREGYGQDAATLLRSLLENLISVKYILHDSNLSDHKAVRFVEYKWVILKKYLSQSEVDSKGDYDDVRKEIFLNKSLIFSKFEEYKKKYAILSPKALLTWSGKALRDMAKLIDKNLLAEYELAFRSSSRFSHPGIIGDNEYLNYEDCTLTFSPQPSPAGVIMNLKRSVRYLFEFLSMLNDLFGLSFKEKLDNFRVSADEVLAMEKYSERKSSSKSLDGLYSEDKKNIAVKLNGISMF